MFEKLESFTKDVSDLSDRPALSSTELKNQFDAAPNEVREYLNKLIDALKKTESGDSGAKNIGVTSIPGITGNDIQSLLEKLSERGGFCGKGGNSFNSGFLIFPTNAWITEINANLYEKSGESNIIFKKSGLYKVELSCTRSDLPGNQYWEIGFSINNDAAKLVTEKMVMGQYGWNQSGGPNLAAVPLHLSYLVRVNVNDYINFNNSSQDGPRGYTVKFNVTRISD